MNNIDVYIITGSCGVGKSTISRALAEKYNLSVHINADYIYHMYVGGYIEPWKDDGSRLSLLRENLSSMIQNFSKNNYNVVIDYVVFPDDINLIVKELGDIRVKYVVLMADQETIIKRDLLRDVDEKMGERVVELLSEFKDKNVDDKYIIDTSKLTVEDVVEKILKEDRFLWGCEN